MSFINRHISEEISKATPPKAVSIFGPRRIGKTTLLERLVGTGMARWYNGDAFGTAEVLRFRTMDDAKNALLQAPAIVIDEAHKIPDIGNIVKMLVDVNEHLEKPRQLFVTSSSSLYLAFLKESALGRVTSRQMWPLSISEIAEFSSWRKVQENIEHHLLYGLMPSVYFSKRIYDNQYETLTENLTRIKKKYEKDPKTLDEQEKALLSRFMNCTNEGKVKIIQSAVNDYLKFCGVRVLVSDCISDPILCHQAYQDRNRVEYAFNTLKSRFACNCLRVHENGTLRGKMFVQILATSVASIIRNRITRYNETARLDKNTYRVCYDSDEKLLAKLNNIMVTSFRDGWYFGEVAGKRAQLFNILGVKKPEA